MRTADTQLVLAFEIERAKADAKADAEERRVIDEYVQANFDAIRRFCSGYTDDERQG